MDDLCDLTLTLIWLRVQLVLLLVSWASVCPRCPGVLWASQLCVSLLMFCSCNQTWWWHHWGPFLASFLAECWSVCECNQTCWWHHWGPLPGQLQVSASLQRLILGFFRRFQWPHSPKRINFFFKHTLNSRYKLFKSFNFWCWSADSAAVLIQIQF